MIISMMKKKKKFFFLLLCLLLCSAVVVQAEESKISHVVYVYVTACESCAKVEDILNDLPEEIKVQTKEGEVISSVCVEKIELSKNLPQVQNLFEICQVPEDDRITPIIFVGENYLAGVKQIEEHLYSWLSEGKGFLPEGSLMAGNTEEQKDDDSAAEEEGKSEDTPSDDRDKVDFGVLNGISAVAAGLVGGLNPCALSMLLLFLTTLLSVDKNPRMYAGIFLISKFIVYLLIGTVLFNAFRVWNPTWLPSAVRWLLTGLGFFMILLNVSDAAAAYQEQYGKIRNQLPARIRNFLHGKIKNVLNGKFLMLSVLGLGVVVALSEFFCAGQVYLATLLTAVQTSPESAYWLLLLLLYCISFLVPSIVVCALVTGKRSSFAVSAWLAQKMPFIKLLTAVVIAGLIVAAWIL